MSKTKDKASKEFAKKWFHEKYHTPLASVPVLLGIHPGDGKTHGDVEDWKDFPIEEVLIEFANELGVKQMQEEIERLRTKLKKYEDN